jgi:hypothetical protein
MQRTNDETKFFTPDDGWGDCEIAEIHPKGEKSTRWEFNTFVDGNVQRFSVWLFPADENKILDALGYVPTNGKYDWDDKDIIGKPLKMEIGHKDNFVKIKTVKGNPITKKDDEEIPFD